MKRFIRQLDKDLILCLSSNAYYLNLVQNDQNLFRIDSDEKIMYFNQIKFTTLVTDLKGQKSINKVKFVIIFNRRLQWSIFVIFPQKQPKQIFWGKICLNQYQNFNTNKASNFQVVEVHQVGKKLIILRNDLKIYQLIINQAMRTKLTDQLFSKTNKQDFKAIQVKQLLIFPLKQSPYLSYSYLPSIQTNDLFKSLLTSYTNQGKKSSQNDYKFQLFLVFRSKNNGSSLKQDPQTLYSIYSLILDTINMTFLSGSQCMLNIPDQIMDMYVLNQNKNILLIQTTKQLYIWSLSANTKENKITKYSQFQFPTQLILYTKQNSGSFTYTGVVSSTILQPLQQNNGSNCTKIIKIAQDKQDNLIFQQLFRLKNNKQKIMYCFKTSDEMKDSYVFLDNYSIGKLGNLHRQGCIMKDQSVSINFARLSYIEPNTNVLYFSKKTGFSQEKVIMTNSFLETNRKEYRHNIPLKNAQIKGQILTSLQTNVILLSSSVIGTLPLKFGKQSQNEINFSTEQSFKPLTCYETLAISQSGKIVVNPHQIVFSLETNKLGKYPCSSMQKLFEGSVQNIDLSIIFQKSSTFILGLDDQIHVFEGNSQKNLKRKFIHCFSGNIKNMFKLNHVNVFGVELYQNHNQNDQFEQRSHQMNSFQVYVLGQDKITLLNKINYGDYFSNVQNLQFLSHINTVPYYFNLVYGKLILVSSQQTHRYNPQKIKLQIYQFPLPNEKIDKFQLIPVINLTVQDKLNLQNEFLIIFPSQQTHSNSIFSCIFSRKILLKSFKQIKFIYEALNTEMIQKNQKVLFSTVQTQAISANKRNKKIILFTQKKCIHIHLSAGKIIVSDLTPNMASSLEQKFGARTNRDLNQYSGLQKIQGLLKICQKQLSTSSSQQARVISTISSSQSSKVVIYNTFQIWLALIDQARRVISPISVYTMLNNEFLQFRNNLSVQQIDEPQFVEIFSLKLPIIQVKYLDDHAIIVLFEKQVVVLQIGQNNSLSVRQQIKFNKPKQNQQIHQQQPDNQSANNEYSQIKIIELLGRYSQTNIFLKDVQGRLYRFQLNQSSRKYQVKFDRNLQEDIVCIGRVKRWDQQKLAIPLIKPHSQTQLSDYRQDEVLQQIVVKKDSQLLLKDLSTEIQRSQYI